MAAVWYRQTFSAAVDKRRVRDDTIHIRSARTVARRAAPDTTEDPLGTRAVLEDAYYKFSRMLHGAPAAAGHGAVAFYRSFVPDRACEHALPASGRARQALTSLRARRGDHIPRRRRGLTHAARTQGHSGRYHSDGRS